MKREFRHEDFEDFIKRSADNLRMKAPDTVWEKLSGEIRRSRRSWGIGLSAFFLVASLLGYFTIQNHTHHSRIAERTAATVPALVSTPRVTATESLMTAAPFSETRTTTIARNSPSLRQNERPSIPMGRPRVTPDFGIAATGATVQQTAATGTAAVDEPFEPTIVDDYPSTEGTGAAARETSQTALDRFSLATTGSASPWTIESVLNARLRKRWKESRWQTQYHLTPTISYRKLSENKSYLRNSPQGLSQPNYNTLYDNINNMVTHKPALGFEFGITEKFALSETVKIRAGLQFNVNRYEIKAFQAPFALATIALNNRRTARVDSLWTIANYSNVDVSRTNRSSWLQNYSFQVSAPVGVELALKGTEKMQFGVAATVQPTYVLGDRAYMITSDYKSYTQVPWLLRRWNVNTALETFVSYQSGKTRWQVGPQVRYQLLSSFISNYPVKENLFDFGLKVGVSLNNK